MDARDFEGAEEILASALRAPSPFDAFVHFQYGRLYRAWNKMTSAVNHLNHAAELAQQRADQMLLMQIVEELKAVKRAQLEQRP